MRHVVSDVMMRLDVKLMRQKLRRQKRRRQSLSPPSSKLSRK
jgi:hypothetical protein